MTENPDAGTAAYAAEVHALNALPKTDLVRHMVAASEVKAGDYLDRLGKCRVHATNVRGGVASLAWRIRGSRAPGVTRVDEAQTVAIWRREVTA
jgi:hypothetical protein